MTYSKILAAPPINVNIPLRKEHLRWLKIFKKRKGNLEILDHLIETNRLIQSASSLVNTSVAIKNM